MGCLNRNRRFLSHISMKGEFPWENILEPMASVGKLALI